MRLFTVIRIYRAFKGLKIKPLADEIGISAKALAQIEDGNTPKGDVLAKVLTWAMSEENSVIVSSEPEQKKGDLFNGES